MSNKKPVRLEEGATPQRKPTSSPYEKKGATPPSKPQPKPPAKK